MNRIAPAATVCLLMLGAVFAAIPTSAQGPLPLPQIVNGTDTHDFPTTGALLSGSSAETALTECSGTLIGCDMFLTAAHCVCSGIGADCQDPNAPDPSGFFIYLQHAGLFTVSDIDVHPDFDFPEADVALVKLGSAASGIAPTPLNLSASPPFGTAGTIAGFGITDGSADDFGIKRAGEVTTASCDPPASNLTSVCWDFELPIGLPGTDSNTCSGDSGGPLFVDLGAGEVVAGITSGGNSTCQPADNAYDTDVFVYATWIQGAATGGLGQSSCGGLLSVGDPEVIVEPFAGSLSAGTPQGTHSFSVPSGISVLRVTMNAHDAIGDDFDLYVKQGSPPTPGDNDCAQGASGQFAACEFVSPTAGTWHVLVDRIAGAGTYQVTTTRFPVLPPIPLFPDLAP